LVVEDQVGELGYRRHHVGGSGVVQLLLVVGARESACGCGNARETTCGRGREHSGMLCGENAGVGMVYAVDQELNQVYQSESALRTGTLFPELHKPLNGYCPGDCNCSCTGQQSGFAAWELRLYLDTHPDDEQALAFFRRLCRETEDPCYATAFLDDGCCGGARWGWTDDPWPWECRPCGQ
jgi:spore coat protein JB